MTPNNEKRPGTTGALPDLTGSEASLPETLHMPRFGTPGYDAWCDGFTAGLMEGADARALLEGLADRYYYEFTRRKAQPFIDPNSPSFPELQAIRHGREAGEEARARIAAILRKEPHA